jgi:hypothetical protein
MRQFTSLRAGDLSVGDVLALRGRTAVAQMSVPVGQRLVPWLRSREGIASVVLTVVLSALLMLSDFPFLAGLLTGTALGCGGVSVAARWWNGRTAPESPPFCAPSSSPAGSGTIRRDANAGFWIDRGGFLGDRRIWFAATGCAPVRLTSEAYTRLRTCHDHGEGPVLVARSPERRWWWWRAAFYWDASDYGAQEL